MATLKEMIEFSAKNPKSPQAKVLLNAVSSGKMDEMAKREKINLSGFKSLLANTSPALAQGLSTVANTRDAQVAKAPVENAIKTEEAGVAGQLEDIGVGSNLAGMAAKGVGDVVRSQAGLKAPAKVEPDEPGFLAKAGNVLATAGEQAVLGVAKVPEGLLGVGEQVLEGGSDVIRFLTPGDTVADDILAAPFDATSWGAGKLKQGASTVTGLGERSIEGVREKAGVEASPAGKVVGDVLGAVAGGLVPAGAGAKAGGAALKGLGAPGKLAGASVGSTVGGFAPTGKLPTAGDIVAGGVIDAALSGTPALKTAYQKIKKAVAPAGKEAEKQAYKLGAELLQPSAKELTMTRLAGNDTSDSVKEFVKAVKKADDFPSAFQGIRDEIKTTFAKRNKILESNNFRIAPEKTVKYLEDEIAAIKKKGLATKSQTDAMNEVLENERLWLKTNGPDRVTAQQRKEDIYEMALPIYKKQELGTLLDNEAGRAKAFELLGKGYREVVENGEKAVQLINSRYGGLKGAEELLAKRAAAVDKSISPTLTQRAAEPIVDVLSGATGAGSAQFWSKAAARQGRKLDKTIEKIMKLRERAGIESEVIDDLINEVKLLKMPEVKAPSRVESTGQAIPLPAQGVMEGTGNIPAGTTGAINPKLKPLYEEAKKYKSAEEFVKAQQFKKISKENPMTDSYHTGIRDASEIKTFRETLSDSESFVNPDFTKEMAEKALKSGEITIYSSKPLDKSISQFVTPSRMMASDYAGSGKVYSKKVNVDDIAWINGDEGNFVGKSQLTDIWNEANRSQVVSPKAKSLAPNDLLERLRANPQLAKEVEDISKIGLSIKNPTLQKALRAAVQAALQGEE